MLVRSLKCPCGAVIGVMLPEIREERLDPALYVPLPVGWLGADEDGQVWDTRKTDTYACKKCGEDLTPPAIIVSDEPEGEA